LIPRHEPCKRQEYGVNVVAPSWERTVHCIGDLHAGAITAVRMAALTCDLARLPAPALHLQIGDATEHATPAQDRLARRFLDGLPAPWVTVLGNHDIWRGERSPAEWARAYDQESRNFSVDLDFVRLIAIGPDRSGAGREAGRLSSATLRFLEGELSNGPEQCWIACHWPLFHTVMGDPHLHFTSAMPAFHAKPDDRIRELLARHRNARVWLSGHTHSPLSAPGFIKRVRLGRRQAIVAVNTSALVGLGKRRNPRAPLCSLYLTRRRDHLEIRARDHRAGSWRNIRGRRVVTLPT
jgi:3',5'-cyclic AMP phosphodiesterase CpdA